MHPSVQQKLEEEQVLWRGNNAPTRARFAIIWFLLNAATTIPTAVVGESAVFSLAFVVLASAINAPLLVVFLYSRVKGWTREYAVTDSGVYAWRRFRGASRKLRPNVAHLSFEEIHSVDTGSDRELSGQPAPGIVGPLRFGVRVYANSGDVIFLANVRDREGVAGLIHERLRTDTG